MPPPVELAVTGALVGAGVMAGVLAVAGLSVLGRRGLIWIRRHNPWSAHPMSEEYNLDTIVEQRREAVGGDDIVFTWKGEKYNFPHPLLASDEWKQACSDADEDDVSQVEAMLGEEQFAKFASAGGQSGFVMLLVQKVQRGLMDEMRDESGERRPTRSSTSSRKRRKR